MQIDARTNSRGSPDECTEQHQADADSPTSPHVDCYRLHTLVPFIISQPKTALILVLPSYRIRKKC